MWPDIYLTTSIRPLTALLLFHSTRKIGALTLTRSGRFESRRDQRKKMCGGLSRRLLGSNASLGGSVQMEATYTQTPQLLTVDRQGFAFRKTDLIPIDNKPEIQEDSLLVRAIYDSHA